MIARKGAKAERGAAAPGYFRDFSARCGAGAVKLAVLVGVVAGLASMAAAQTPTARPATKAPAALPKTQPTPNITETPVRQPAPAPPRTPVPSVKDLKFPKLGPIQIPKVEIATLPNGMRLYLLEDHELPIINGTARVRTGNLFDPPDKVGLAGVTGTVMRSGGTKELTGDQIDERLENIAASVEAGIGETSGTVSFSSMKETADQVMAIFHDVLTAPEFRQDRIDLAKTQIRSSIARRNDNAHGIVGREFSDIVYGRDNPYGWRVEYATIDPITRADLVEFHRRYFFPGNVLLAVRGDFSAAEMKAKLEKLFGGWTAQQPPVPAFPPVKSVTHPGTYLAVKKDVTQTFFSVGHLGGEFRDADYPALEVMADILGGGFRSRLVMRIRSKMGAAYSISADWGANYDHPGLFQISGSTKSLSTVDTLKAVREELDRIRTSEVTEAELETAKQSALNSLVFAFDTKAKTLGRMITYEYFGYPKDFIDRYQKALAAVTRADVLRVAKEHLKPENLTVVAVGNPADFGTPLESLGPVSKIDLTIPQGPARKVDAAGLAEGRKLLQRMQQAVGGTEKTAAVKDMVQSLEMRIVPEAGGMTVRQTDRWISPAFLRQESVLPAGRITAFTDGEVGWIATPQGSGGLGGAQLQQVRGDLFRNYFRMMAADRYGYLAERQAPDTVELSDGKGMHARLTLDPDTSLPKSLVYESVQAAGSSLVTETYSDFRDVSGIKVPFRVAIAQGGRKFADVEVKECKLNTGLKPEELSARPR